VGRLFFSWELSGFILAVQQKTADLPPGVLAQNWIPINGNAGVALNMGTDQSLSGKYYRSHGTLMIKQHGLWQEVYLDTAPARIMPLQVK